MNNSSKFGLEPRSIELLSKHLDIQSIQERDGAGSKKLKYLKGDYVIGRANEIFGFGQWAYKIVSRGKETIDTNDGVATMYTCEVELHVNGAMFPFIGDGVGLVSGKKNNPNEHEKAYKEASTDAIKRALRHYGDQFGLSLYDQEDLVDAGNGTLVPVSDVVVVKNGENKVKGNQRPAQPIQQPGLILKEKLRDLFARGRKLDLFTNADEFAGYVKDALDLDAPIEPRMLTEEQGRDLEAMIFNRERQSA